MGKLVDLIGKRFGRWRVLEPYSKRYRSGRTCLVLWLCRCDCGTKRVVIGTNLRAGKSTGCGCIRGERRTTHGHTRGRKQTRAYRIWNGMRQRCFNPNNPAYADYGGRGITVCENWRDDFESFFADMLDPPLGLTLDRIDNDGNYEPGNCRWASYSMQNSNRRCLPKTGITP